MHHPSNLTRDVPGIAGIFAGILAGAFAARDGGVPGADLGGGRGIDLPPDVC